MFLNLLNKIRINLKTARWSEDFGKVNLLLKNETDFDLALEILNKILMSESSSEIRIIVFIYKAMVLYFLKRYEESIENCNFVLKSSPDLGKGLLMIKGDALRHLGKYKEASKVYEELLMINPKDIDVLMNNSLCLNALGEYQNAINTLNDILEIEPYNIKAINNKSILLNFLSESENEVIVMDSKGVIKIIIKNVPSSNVWIVGEQVVDESWNLFIVDTETNSKELSKKNVSTLVFVSVLEKIA